MPEASPEAEAAALGPAAPPVGGLDELSLFTGVGGGLLASKMLGWRTRGYVEVDDHCQRSLARKIRNGQIENAPIFGDVRAFLADGYADSYSGMVDVVSGGFPCQPFSAAGAGLAGSDERNLWPETREVLRAVRSRFAFFENVAALVTAGERFCPSCGSGDFEGSDELQQTRCRQCGRRVEDPAALPVDRYFGTILGDLADVGYGVRWCVLSSGDVGAPHIRRRVWIRCEAE